MSNPLTSVHACVFSAASDCCVIRVLSVLCAETSVCPTVNGIRDKEG